MSSFDVGETIICSVEVTDAAGDYADPATSMNIEIYLVSPYTVVVSSTAMSKDSTGHYHYDFQSASKVTGDYRVKYIATDGTRITIETEDFKLSIGGD